MKATRISENGLNIVKKYEGFYSKPYLCPAKVPTIGYGTTYYPNGKKVTLKDSEISKESAEYLLRQNLISYEKAVDSFTTDLINQNQFDALVSFAYNLGIDSLRKSTLLKLVNKNPNNDKIMDEFLKWVYAGGRKLNGLVKRRNEEATLYFKP